jgi:FkbM family methyltransferase
VARGPRQMENLALMNIRKLLFFKFNSSLLRKALSLRFREDHFYRIPFGAISGSKLYYRKDINFHAMMGVWEKESLRVLKRIIYRFGLNQPNKVIADVGANIGYYSIFFSKYLDDSAKIFAFEPSLEILPVLRKNIMINNVYNVKILDLAAADHTGRDEFFVAEHHHESSLLREWSNNATTATKTVVATITLDDFFERFNQSRFPDLIKMDIEGGGIYALKGCTKCITTNRPFILIESHNQGEDQAVSHLLQQFNYEAYRATNDKWIIYKDRDFSDPDGVWGTMLLMPAERKADFIN